MLPIACTSLLLLALQSCWQATLGIVMPFVDRNLYPGHDKFLFTKPGTLFGECTDGLTIDEVALRWLKNNTVENTLQSQIGKEYMRRRIIFSRSEGGTKSKKQGSLPTTFSHTFVDVHDSHCELQWDETESPLLCPTKPVSNMVASRYPHVLPEVQCRCRAARNFGKTIKCEPVTFGFHVLQRTACKNGKHRWMKGLAHIVVGCQAAKIESERGNNPDHAGTIVT